MSRWNSLRDDIGKPLIFGSELLSLLPQSLPFLVHSKQRSTSQRQNGYDPRKRKDADKTATCRPA